MLPLTLEPILPLAMSLMTSVSDPQSVDKEMTMTNSGGWDISVLNLHKRSDQMISAPKLTLVDYFEIGNRKTFP